jgi:hypothetical protein
MMSAVNGPACAVFAPSLTRALVVLRTSRANMRPPASRSKMGDGRIAVGRRRPGRRSGVYLGWWGHSGAPSKPSATRGFFHHDV